MKLINSSFLKKLFAGACALIIATNANASTSYPLKVKAENGEVVIKTKPKRIVVLEFGLLDELKLLGVKPVGIGTSDATEGNDPEHLQTFIKTIPSVGTRDEPSLEAIAKLKPDLIIGDYSLIANLLPQLNKIAPTLLMNGILGNPNEQVKNLKTLAKVTDTETKVPAILKQYNKIKAQAEKIAAKSPQKTILIGFVTPSGVFRVLTANAIATPILNELNRKNLITEVDNMHRVDITVESVINKNPDQIILLLTDGNKAPYEKLASNPLWNDVRANKENQVYFMDRNVWAKTHGIEAMEIMYKEAMSSGMFNTESSK
ncbi:MAG: iron-siderophore ABC transporter substrate-binding protein [Burkholderiales bacterium]|nr:iron-siderophore ABC transporter substrate-binding protein [Burkholderiales bacterium]